MPTVMFPVPETSSTIIRPVVYNIIDQITLLTTIARDIRVLFPGASEVGYQIGSTIGTTPPPENTFLSEDQLTVKIDENIVEDRVINTAVDRPENRTIFLDSALGIDIRPIYSFVELTLNFTYRSSDLNRVRRFRDALKTRRSQGRVEVLHEIDYSYGLPLPFIKTLGELYTMREAVAGYGDTFNHWFTSHVDDRFTVVTNQAGKQPSIVIREEQIGVLGWFDFLVMPEEPQRAAGQPGTGATEVSFTYKIQFDKPVECIMRYPTVVHNQLIPYHLRDAQRIYQLNQRKRAPSLSRYLFDKFTPLYSPDQPITDGVRYPDFDDWIPGEMYPFTSTLIMLLTQTDLETPTNLCSLYELGVWSLDPVILAFLVGEAPYLTVYNASVVNLSLYEDRALMPDTALKVDSDLNVTTTFSMNPRKVYHLRISLVNDLITLPVQARERLRHSGAACLKILATLEHSLPGGVSLPTLTDNSFVRKDDFLAAGRRIDSHKTPILSNLDYIFEATVGTFTVAAGTEN